MPKRPEDAKIDPNAIGEIQVTVNNRALNIPITLLFGGEEHTTWTNPSPQTMGPQEVRTFTAESDGSFIWSLDAYITLQNSPGTNSAIKLHNPMWLFGNNDVTKEEAGFPLDFQVGPWNQSGGLEVQLMPLAVGEEDRPSNS